MKRIIPLLFWTMLLSHACASPGSLVTPTVESVTAMATATLTPTAIQPPTPKPPEPTQTKSEDITKYTTKPASIEGFQEGPSVEYIFDTLIPELDRLNKLPNSPLPQFAEGTPPVVAELVKNAQGVEFKINLGCNLDGNSVNCIPVAYIKIGGDKYVTILKIRNGDGTDGFFPWWNAGWWGQRRINRIVDNVSENPTGRRVIEIEIRPGGPNDDNVILQEYFEDEDFVNAILEFVNTQVFPRKYRNIVPGGAWD